MDCRGFNVDLGRLTSVTLPSFKCETTIEHISTLVSSFIGYCLILLPFEVLKGAVLALDAMNVVMFNSLSNMSPRMFMVSEPSPHHLLL